MSKVYEALTKLYSPTGIRSGDSNQLPGFRQRSIHLYLPGREEGARVPHWRSPDPGVRGLPSRLSCRQRPTLQLLQQLHVKVSNLFVFAWGNASAFTIGHEGNFKSPARQGPKSFERYFYSNPRWQKRVIWSSWSNLNWRLFKLIKIHGYSTIKTAKIPK